jgi:hypothetical protein
MPKATGRGFIRPADLDQLLHEQGETRVLTGTPLPTGDCSAPHNRGAGVSLDEHAVDGTTELCRRPGAAPRTSPRCRSTSLNTVDRQVLTHTASLRPERPYGSRTGQLSRSCRG